MSFRRLQTCGTPLCGYVERYFCVRCRHYVWDCLCTPGWCACEKRDGWAAPGERRMVEAQLAEVQA